MPKRPALSSATRCPSLAGTLMMMLSLVVMSGCGGSPGAESSEPSPSSNSVPTQSDASIDVHDTATLTVEPGTGTDIEIVAPADAPSERDVTMPITVTVAESDSGWTEAAIVIETDGDLAARADIDLSALRPGGRRAGMLTLELRDASYDGAVSGVVTLYLELREGDDVVNARTAQIAVLDDGETTRVGFGSVGDLERQRLDDLLAAGDITQDEYDNANDSTTEVVTGSVEIKD